jgi:hypothetical protein
MTAHQTLTRRIAMSDLLYLGIAAAFFIGSALYVRFCANL